MKVIRLASVHYFASSPCLVQFELAGQQPALLRGEIIFFQHHGNTHYAMVLSDKAGVYQAIRSGFDAFDLRRVLLNCLNNGTQLAVVSGYPAEGSAWPSEKARTQAQANAEIHAVARIG